MKKFIITPTINNNNHVIPIERIISVEPYIGNSKELKSEIVVSDPAERFFSTLTAEQVYDTIQTENYR